MTDVPATLGASDEHYRRLGVSRNRIELVELCVLLLAWPSSTSLCNP